MPGFPAAWEDFFRKWCESSEELPSLLGTLPFRIVYYCYLLYSTVCHLRKYWNVKLSHMGSEQVTYYKGHWLTVWFKTYLSWEGPPTQESFLSFLHGVLPSDDMVNEEEDTRAAIWQLKVAQRRQLLCSWLESWKEGRTAAPSSSSIPGTVLTFFYSCLQTRRAKSDGHCSCNVCSEENEHFIFEKGWCVFVPGVCNLIL